MYPSICNNIRFEGQFIETKPSGQLFCSPPTFFGVAMIMDVSFILFMNIALSVSIREGNRKYKKDSILPIKRGK